MSYFVTPFNDSEHDFLITKEYSYIKFASISQYHLQRDTLHFEIN